MLIRTRVAIAAALLPATVLTAAAAAQGGETSAIVLELPASARAMALGGAGVALDGDAAVFYNPAQLATVGRAAVGLSVQRYIMSSTLGAVSMGARFGPGTVALGAQILQYASEPEIVPDDAFAGERGRLTGSSVDAGDLAVTAGYAIERGRVRVGAAAKFVRQRIVDEAGTAVAADVGVAARVWGATIAAAVQNLGNSVEIATMSGDLPRLVRVGAALPVRATDRVSLLLTGDVVSPFGGDATAGGGGELVWQATPAWSIAGRLGAAMLEDDADGSPFSAGAAILGRNLALDYAFRSFDALGGGMHRIGVRWWR